MDLYHSINTHLGKNLGGVFKHLTNRLLLYAFMFSFLLAECFIFWLMYQGPQFVLNYMAFTTVFTLHKASAYIICIAAVDVLIHHAPTAWGAYDKRTVGCQLMIWSVGLTMGYLLQKTLVRSLIPIYAPEVLYFFMADRPLRVGNLPLFLVLTPYWLLMMLVTLRIGLSIHRFQQIDKSLKVIPEGHLSQTPPGKAIAPKSIQSGPNSPQPLGGKLQWDGLMGPIELADITHVTVEDHYCRLHFTTDDGPKSEMIRLPMRKMMEKLPATHFLRIHRSHVVNAAHVTRLVRNGRDHKVVLQNVDQQLPVSRSRFKALRPHLCPR